jgi:D-beta-D-heptose 7-phosphate kinase/D-beta-D-heptose 1-phosphate adenosyltransferase
MVPTFACREIVTRFAEKRVLVVGDVMLDEYVWGKVTRISPEAPVPIVEVERKSCLAGGAANVARNLVSLGATVRLVGLVGDDAEGALLAGIFAESGIDGAGLVVDDGRPTTVKTRIVAHGQQVLRIDRESREPLAVPVRRRALAAAIELLPEVDAVVLSDYAKGLVDATVCSGVIRRASLRQMPVVVDPKGRDFSRYAGATAITPNEQEAALAANREIRDEPTLVEVGRALREAIGCRAVLITRGEAGMTLLEDGSDVVHLPTFGRKVYDVTGAGDTVVSTFVLGLAAGAGLAESAYLANHAAGIVVGRLGAATVTPRELIAATARQVIVGSRRSRESRRRTAA